MFLFVFNYSAANCTYTKIRRFLLSLLFQPSSWPSRFFISTVYVGLGNVDRAKNLQGTPLFVCFSGDRRMFDIYPIPGNHNHSHLFLMISTMITIETLLIGCCVLAAYVMWMAIRYCNLYLSWLLWVCDLFIEGEPCTCIDMLLVLHVNAQSGGLWLLALNHNWSTDGCNCIKIFLAIVSIVCSQDMKSAYTAKDEKTLFEESRWCLVNGYLGYLFR